MSKLDIIRAWKDESYRMSLSEAERTQLPDNPAGPAEICDAESIAAEVSAMSATFNAGCLATKSYTCSLCDYC